MHVRRDHSVASQSARTQCRARVSSQQMQSTAGRGSSDARTTGALLVDSLAISLSLPGLQRGDTCQAKSFFCGGEVRMWSARRRGRSPESRYFPRPVHRRMIIIIVVFEFLRISADNSLHFLRALINFFVVLPSIAITLNPRD